MIHENLPIKNGDFPVRKPLDNHRVTVSQISIRQMPTPSPS